MYYFGMYQRRFCGQVVFKFGRLSSLAFASVVTVSSPSHDTRVGNFDGVLQCVLAVDIDVAKLLCLAVHT